MEPAGTDRHLDDAPALAADSRNDAQLVAAMTAADPTAMSALYDRYAPGILGLALRITRERADAEDVVVDTFAQVWRDAVRFHPDRGSVAAWIVTIARSRSLDLLRSRARRTRLDERAHDSGEPGSMGGAAPSAIATILSDERTERVRTALAQLPEAQRRALELAYFEGLSQSEIAARLGEPLGTVKTRMRLGLRRLRTLLAPLGPGATT